MSANRNSSVPVASGLNILLGALYIALPWLLGYASTTGALAGEEVVVGALIMICALLRVARPGAGANWSGTNIVLGLWVMILPLTFGYTLDEVWSWASALIGVAVSLAAWRAKAALSPFSSRTG